MMSLLPVTSLSPHIAACDYDYVILGGGVSGLCLAYYLAQQIPHTASILVIDKDKDPDYNISFWAEGEVPFQPIMRKTWHQIGVRYGDQERRCPLKRYNLQAFWRADFDEYLNHELKKNHNTDFLDANVGEVNDCHHYAEVNIDLNGTPSTIRAAWVFDSRTSIAAIKHSEPDLLLMQGLAWEIQTNQPRFDPDIATLFDFLTDTPDFDFVYVLPYTSTFALVNYAHVAAFTAPNNKATCEAILKEYISERLHIANYEVTKSCYGRIPLSSHHAVRNRSSRIVPIGVKGGMVKSSTSYAFTRILTDSQQIASSLQQIRSPYYSDHRAWYYQWADNHMGNVFLRQPQLAQELMFNMFSEDSGDLVLSFLDEKNTLAENQQLFRNMPNAVLRKFLISLLLHRS